MGQWLSAPGPADTKFVVIGSGLPRSGTKSFWKACSILLDGPAHDSGVHSVAGKKAMRDTWLKLMAMRLIENKTPDEQAKMDSLLKETLTGYVSITDMPGGYFTEDLLRLYPDAIVISTTREKNSWFSSFDTLQQMVQAPMLPWLLWPMPVVSLKPFFDLHRENWNRLWGGQDVDAMERHAAWLRKVVPPERLHFFNVREGWGPLCKILNKPIPDEPFPHLNDRAEITAGIKRYTYYGASILVLVTAITLYAVGSLGLRRQS